jgi:hypothetical protein
MAYTATMYVSPFPNPYPRGADNTQRTSEFFGILAQNDTATQYSVGGVGSSAFEVTAFSAVGLVTYSALVGAPLVNGARVVVYNTASNTNDGTYIVSGLTTTSSTAGTFTAVPLPGNSLAGSAQTSQTAEGVQQILWGDRATVNQTLTLTAVTVSGSIATITYTTLVGPQLQPGQSIVVTGMTNAGNNGTFSINSTKPTSATGGSFLITNTSAVASDSGSATASVIVGIDNQTAAGVPVWVDIRSGQLGWIYQFDPVNYTMRIFATGSGSGAVLAEVALGPHAVFDNYIQFHARFVRSAGGY